jgi:flagella basal body P-ring formation protein FlgA
VTTAPGGRKSLHADYNNVFYSGIINKIEEEGMTMKKTAMGFLVLCLVACAAPARGAAYPPVHLEGVQVSRDDGASFLMELLTTAYGGKTPFSRIVMEPEVFGVFGEIVTPDKLTPGSPSATFRVKTGSGRIQAVTVRFEWHAPMVVATREIARGEIIPAEALDVRVATYSRSDGRVFADISGLEGTRASRRIRAGSALSHRDVDVVYLVERRDPVMVLSRNGFVTASLEGVALEGGDRGDLIEVRIPRYRNDRLAVITGRGKVELVGTQVGREGVK